MYILVTGRNGKYVIRGQIEGYDATDKRFWRSPNGRPGAWFVPQSALIGI